MSCFDETYLKVYLGNTTDIQIQVLDADSTAIVIDDLVGLAVSLKNLKTEQIDIYSLLNSTGLPFDISHGEITILDSLLGLVSIRIYATQTEAFEDGQYLQFSNKLYFDNGNILDADPIEKAVKVLNSDLSTIEIPT